MRRHLPTSISLLAVVLVLDPPVMTQDNAAVFSFQIAPVLQTNCAGCHGGSVAQGGFSMASFDSVLRGGKHGSALTPGSASQSLLMQYVRGEKIPRMPLGSQLPAEIIEQLAQAINGMRPLTDARPADAHWEWLLTKPKASPLPAVKDAGWVRNPVDAFVLGKLEQKGLLPAPPASRRALIRRLYFDLIGLPPSPEEVKQFVEDHDSAAWDKLIDRLLADPRYGERWGRHWLDVVRYAESDGFAVDTERPTAWRYRDYVIRSFNSDKPYDLFIKEQLAGDELRDEQPAEGARSERLVSLGFLRMATWEADATSKQQLRQDFLNEITGTTASVFLGLTAGCSQCHNHKYDPIPQRDFYRLQAFFAATGVDEVPAPFIEAENPREMKRLYRHYEDEVELAKEELERRKEQLKMRFMESKKLKADDAAVTEFLRELNVANAFFQERGDPIFKEDVWKNYLSAKDKLQYLNEHLQRYRPVAYAVKDLVPPDVPGIPATHLLVAGELSSKGEETEPGFLQCISGTSEPAKIPFAGGSSGRRLALAEWIASPENPLTPRVMVNRIWQYHFGEGLVRTASDFGKNGAHPAHPELLDWLATQFVERKWSIKAMHRLMLASSAYQQSTAHPEWKRYADLDPDNELLWRMNWTRLDAEVLRDTLLLLSGRLNPARGGPGVFFQAPADVAEGFEFFKWFPSSPEQQRRRTIYTFQRRSVVNPMLEVFDVANMNASCSRRNVTTVAPQALTLMNGELTNREAIHFAARILREAGKDPERQLERAFWLVLSPPPSETEREQSLKMLARFPGAEGLAHLAVVLFNLNETLYLE
ncbi:MAG: hypothetical protein DMG09_07385 [Acidobacteria bacterium]|nr:MAG: hypothetical protein DMG09_07385 [Acidobacteriota bacterium]